MCVPGLTPLHAAMLNGDLAMAQMLIAHGAYIEVFVEPDNRTPIHIGRLVGWCVRGWVGRDTACMTILSVVWFHAEVVTAVVFGLLICCVV